MSISPDSDGGVVLAQSGSDDSLSAVGVRSSAGASLAEGFSTGVSKSSMARQSKRKSTNFDDT